MRNLRLISSFPLSQELTALQPFQSFSIIKTNIKTNTKTGDIQVGVKVVADVGPQQEAQLLSVLRKAMLASQTVGICPADLKVRAVFFDMDSTVIAEESIVELARVAGKAAEVAAVTERAMAGEIDFTDALIGRVALLKGLPSNVLREVADKLTLNAGIKEFSGFCRSAGVPIFMVSGGFQVLADIVASKVGFDGILANSLEVVQGLLTGKVSGAIVDAQAKKDFVERTCKRLGIVATEVAAVGDGANDIPMLQAVGVAIGHKPKAVLTPHLHAANHLGDHRLLAPLLFGRTI